MPLTRSETIEAIYLLDRAVNFCRLIGLATRDCEDSETVSAVATGLDEATNLIRRTLDIFRDHDPMNGSKPRDAE